MTVFVRWSAALVAVLCAFSFIAAQDMEGEEESPPEKEVVPGQKTIDRTAKDVALLLPQRGLGGSDKAALDGEPGTPKAFKFESEGQGADKIKAWVATPPGMDKARKHALVFAFAGSGDADAPKDITMVTVMNQSRDPLIVMCMQYREAKDMGEGFSMLEYVAEKDVRRAAYDAALAKALTEFPVDPERVFLMGCAGGDDDVMDYAQYRWSLDSDNFPFRAILVDGLVRFDAADLPPVSMVVCVDAELAKMNAKWGGKLSPKQTANAMLARGIPCQYHEYQYQMFADTWRWQFILRDAIHTLGGPGAREYADSRPVIGVVAPADALPFKDSNDPVITEVLMIAKNEEWGRAHKRLKAGLEDKTVKAKDKKPLQDFAKEWDKYIKAEMDRLNKSIETSIKGEAWAHSLHRARLSAMLEAFKDEKWLVGKPYQANLDKLKTYPPAVRDNARREKTLEAIRLELGGERAKAKAAFQELAKQKTQDGGYSDWPRAAEYRLSWWEELPE